ncbi:pyrroline-5-carboxylate reductase [Akkermansia muciniphila]|jgi:pyrroline-5-carboxylate reductase|nr:pyrroline-5-carboxylate reductase [Akkermansia muciniphila]MBE5699199.1 pyrroline-5-carboxylate reductase [Akkermansia sp.]PNC43612.1 pyrroline-5-carboxylate reductase [Akkermansia muciniphila]PNC63392.1 pyrroline-5-carboxylate reductase [Akkermansia muciniphila]PNC74390.1 pyrroline-5-carboxylate reductase [Akkermansia muciniphila]
MGLNWHFHFSINRLYVDCKKSSTMKTGIIGLGKMGGALLRGMLKAGAAVPEEVWVYDHHHENVQALQEEYPGVHEAASEADAADAVEVLILAVKPHGVLPLISSLSERGAELPLLISIAAAVSLDDMEACASDGTRIIRAMPNTPCMVLAGVIAYSTGNGVKDEDEEAARKLLSGCGSVYKVAESGMNAVSAISGCGPAYMFTALDALADAGVAMGLSRKTALGLAAETMRGASLMLERTGKHPMALRDEVTSPGGTTIAALNALDECGFRNAWIQAVKSAVRRAEEMEER